MTIFDLLQGDRIEPTEKPGTHGREYMSPCPGCGGRDRFVCWPKEGDGGRWHCRTCERSGDLIEYLKAFRNLSYPEACEYLGQEPEARRPAARIARPATWQPREHPAPLEGWRTAAEAFCRQARDALWSRAATGDAARKWLCRERGMATETVRHHGLGWHTRDAWVSRTAWSLPEERDDAGRPRRLWLPAGLVLPTRDPAGGLIRLKIRRPRKDDLPRYTAASGSGTGTWTLPGGPVPVVLESELDGLLVLQEAGDLATVVVLGSAQAKPDVHATRLLRDARLILVALDADDAGAKASRFWLKEFPQARRWPPVQGKDPCEMWKAGVPVRSWIQAALEEHGDPTRGTLHFSGASGPEPHGGTHANFSGSGNGNSVVRPGSRVLPGRFPVRVGGTQKAPSFGRRNPLVNARGGP